jgi:formate-dependent nitrite reductase membrane component NrfD
MFLLSPGKLHPLWYSTFIWIFFLASSIYAALAMAIMVSTLAVRFLKKATDHHFRENLPRQTLGLGKAAAVGIYVYLALKLVGVAHDNNWGLLFTPYGYWFIVEIVGFVLIPALVLTYGVKRQSVSIVRFGAVYAIVGIIVNRINVSMIAFNWNLPDHLHHLIPPWKEVMAVLAIATIHVLIFRWILNRMPVLREEPGYEPH